ncbi:hypothetical protein [Streptomyces sp. NPDC086182]|uniref:hypothetical protein n=1 Tax=Streptomyces sp. NPDC086182 TaxID=3155058 RepID=UPI003448331C
MTFLFSREHSLQSASGASQPKEQAAGAIGRGSTARCRPPPRRRPEADEAGKLLGDGVKVHGDRMVPGARDAFRAVHRERTPGADDTAVGAWLDLPVAGGRCDRVCAMVHDGACRGCLPGA